MCVAAPYLWPNRTWAQALRQSRADSGGELAFSPIWQAIGEATRTRLTGDQNAPSWAVGTLVTFPTKAPRTRPWCCRWRDVSPKGATADAGVVRVDPVPPATAADIEDLSFWLANQFVSNAFEVFYYHFRALCLSSSSIVIISSFNSDTWTAIENLIISSSSFNATTLRVLFKDENNAKMVKIDDEQELHDKLRAEKSRMQKAWPLQQEAKLCSMVAHLNFLFKSDKFEACNVNHLYQVFNSSRHPVNLSVHPCIHPLILCSPSPTLIPRQNG